MLERGEWQLPDPSNVVDSLIGDSAPRPAVVLPLGKTLGTLIDEYIPSVYPARNERQWNLFSGGDSLR